jgi:hypothetical protein
MRNKAFQDDGVCNRGDLKPIGLIDSLINIASGEMKEEMLTDT